jgi:gliding motility-associated-like protein
MNKFLLSVLLFFLCIFYVSAQTVSSGSKGNTKSLVPQVGKINWSLDPFEHALFIENTGEYDDVLPGVKIYFKAKLGGIAAYFTSTGILYKDVLIDPLDFSGGKDPDQDGPPKRHTHYLRTTWQGASPNVTVDADLNDKLSYYYTFPKGTSDTYFANIYKKITYHNLYPGIDVVYSFSEGSNNLEYTIIVHPGADLSKVHLDYKKSKGMHLDASGNIVDNNDIGTLKESAPVCYYVEDHTPVTISTQANNPDESFVVHNLDASKTLAIDPTIQWTTVPFTASTSYDYAYDLDYDDLGNVYCYGGGKGNTTNPLQLIKLNPAGVIQWVFNATTMVSSTAFYGDFAVDKHSLECYCVEGWNAGGGGRIEKVSPTGTLMATDLGNSGFNELWRIQSSICPPGFVMFGNGTCCPDQAAMLDTTMATVNPVNIIGAACTTGYHDMALTAVDPFGGYALTWCTHSLVYGNVFCNDIIKSPIPALSPYSFMLDGHFAFYEIESIFYDPDYTFNAMNGLVCGRMWIYAYNGDTLKQMNRNTGVINAVTRVSSTSYDWGGLDVDLCDNIYVGDSNIIKIYDPSLAVTSTLPTLPGIIYDLKVGPYTGQLVYACGQNYISSISLGPPATVPIVITKSPSCGHCDGTATASAMPCGALDTLNVSYLWSDGETTQTATHLCTGVDTVAVSIVCGLTYKDTVTMNIPPGGYTVTHDSTPATCSGPGSASVTITGGVPPYTYNWSNGSTSSSTGPVSGGVYCVGIQDNTGCFDTLCITVTSTALPNIVVSPTPDTICAGSQVGLTASGGVSYVWTPAGSGLSCYSCANPNASPSTTTTYTVTGSDASGCSNVATAIVNIIPAPVITITAPSDSICINNSVSLTAAGAVTYTWTPTTGLSCSTCTVTVASPTVTTIYTVTGTDAEGCKGTATFTVNVIDPPSITVSPNVSICTGQTTILSASATNTNGNFLWEPGNYNSPSISVSPASTQIYTVSTSNSCGTATATVTVSLLPTPVPDFSAVPSSGCIPLCIQFNNTSTISSGKITQWGWSFGNNDTVNTKNPIYCYTKPGVYSVSLTTVSDSGCSASLNKSDIITVYSNPVANFTAAPQPTTILLPTIQFTDESTDSYGIINTSWNFGISGDSGTSNLLNPSFTYSDTGTFCVKLAVVNAHGCVDTATDCVVISPIFTCYIPDAFTPNGDGVNDLFEVKGRDIKAFEMYIFNRWGSELFHTTDLNTGWNGAVNNAGTICQEDAYVYVIKVTDNKDQIHSFTGTVNLIR